MFKKIEQIVKKQLNKVNLGKAAQAAYVCSVADSYFLQLVKGSHSELDSESYKMPNQVRHDNDTNSAGRYSLVQALSFKNGVLTLAVKNNIEAMEIQADQAKIIEEINRVLTKNIVQKIRFKLY